MAKKVYVGEPKASIPLSEMSVGETVKINVNGVATDFIIVRHGRPSTLYDSSCNDTWLIMKNIYTKRIWDNTNTDYKNSDIHSYLNDTFLKLFDSEVQNLIKQVKIPYVNGVGTYTSTSVSSGSNGLSTKIFLLSAYEIGWSNSGHSSLWADGASLGYFGGDSNQAKNIAYYNGTATKWWTRSPLDDRTTGVCEVSDNGYYTNNDCTSSSGIRPAFVMPSTTHVLNGFITDGISKLGDSVAKKVKQIYVGISDKARRVKKGYIGIGGVARPFWGDYELVYYGTIANLSAGRQTLAATSVGDYALFGGGYNGSSAVATVDAYNKSLTKSTPTALSAAREQLGATTVGGYALFGSSVDSTAVNAYNTSLTRSNPTAMVQKRNYGSTTVGNYALFAGGQTSSSFTNGVVTYNASLTKSTASNLNSTSAVLGATTVGNYALFGGGQINNYANGDTDAVTAYDTSLTKSTPTALSVVRGRLGATTVGNYALFAGGKDSAVVDAYNTSLTRSTPTALSVARSEVIGTTVGNYALFGGGSSGDAAKVVDVYDKSLTRTTTTPFSKSTTYHAGTTIGNYALFGGGRDNANWSMYTTVYAYALK